MNDIYKTLKKRGLTTSQRDFSTACRSPSYLATMNNLTNGAMVVVFRKLIAERRWVLGLRVARMVLFASSRQPCP